jgi:hypothetical protein
MKHQQLNEKEAALHAKTDASDSTAELAQRVGSPRREDPGTKIGSLFIPSRKQKASQLN